jgi:hypothetical protein
MGDNHESSSKENYWEKEGAPHETANDKCNVRCVCSERLLHRRNSRCAR